MKEIHFCRICGTSYGIEDHHIIYRSQVKPLDKCPKNHAYLCHKHHRDHRQGGHFNKKLDKQLKLEFQNWLEESFIKDYYDIEEIREILGIGLNAARSLCKLMYQKNGKYSRDEIIVTCMGGVVIVE